MFVGMRTDETIAAGVTDDDLLEVGPKEPDDPAGQVGFFEHEAFVGSGDGLDMFHQGIGLGTKAPPFEFTALIVEVSQDTILGVGIQAKPCYRSRVSHNEPFYVND